ncbi:protein PFC0760c-like [Dendronephthya gigantea]|uniref:protein PFC0760c-like n=1 Tax=Dendronephthya gigantea TaxID=151771 RepID=UPI001069DA19|nr:protein PFC0760c-like [Dendronephthya gigantea]
MVSGNVEETEKQSKADRKASSGKAKIFANFNNVVDSSCTKLHELFSCQKVAHSVIFYVIIFLLLLVLVYIFRKLVSLPNNNHGKYHNRKHNSSTVSTGSRPSNNESLSKGFPTKWPKLSTVLGKVSTSITGSTDLKTAREKKTDIYGVPENDWHSQENFNYKGYSNSGENHYYGSYSGNDNQIHQPKINSYSSSYATNFPKANQGQASRSNNPSTDYWKSPNQISNYGYGRTAAETSTSGIASISDPSYNQDDQSSRQYISNSGFKSDSNLENSWVGATWDVNSNVQAWPYSGNSASGLTKINQKLQQNSGSTFRSRHRAISNMNNYGKWGSTSWSGIKLGKPGSGFGWIKETDNDHVDSFKPTTTPNWNSYYYDSASGKWTSSNKGVNTYGNAWSDQNIGNTYLRDNNADFGSYTWNPYDNYWSSNQTQELSGYNSPLVQVNSKAREDKLSYHKSSPTNDANSKSNKHFDKTGNSMVQDETEDRIHRWPLEEGHKQDDFLKGLPSITSSSNTKRTKKFWKKRRKLTNHKKNKISHQERKRKASKKAFRNRVRKKIKEAKGNKIVKNDKKSVIAHPSNFEPTKMTRRRNRKGKLRKTKEKNRGKHSHAKERHKKKKVSRKVTKHQKSIHVHSKQFSNNHKAVSHKSKVRGWHRDIHRVKHCKTLQSFKTNGEVHLDKKYLSRQRKYKYTILSCRYVRVPGNSIKHESDDDDLELDDGDDDDDEKIAIKRKQICQKFYFITNGKILLKKTSRSQDQISYIVSLCRANDEPQNPKHSRIKHRHDTTLDEGDYEPRKPIHMRKHVETIDYDDNSKVKNKVENSDRLHDKNLVDDKHKDKIRVAEEPKSNHNSDSYKEKLSDDDMDKYDNNDEDKEGLDEDDSDFDEDMDSDRKRKPQKSTSEDQEDTMNGADDDKDDEFYAETSARNTNSKGNRDEKYNNRHKKKSRPRKTKQGDDDEIDVQDNDDIDDVDVNIDSDTHKVSKTRNKNIANVHKVNDRVEVDNDELDDFDEDFGNDDIMDVKLKTTPRPEQVIWSRLKKLRNKNKAKSRVQHKKANINNIYERMLHELSKKTNTKDRSDDPRKLLMALLKRKLDSVVPSKHVKSKVSKIKFPIKKYNKQRHQFAQKPHKEQNEGSIKAILKNILTNSISVTKTKSQKRLPVTPKAHTKPSIEDLFKNFLPTLLAQQNIGKTTISPTKEPTKGTTTPDQQMKIQFSKLLEKFGMPQNNVQAKKTSLGPSSKEQMNNLLKEVGDTISTRKSKTTNKAPHRINVTPNTPSLPPTMQVSSQLSTPQQIHPPQEQEQEQEHEHEQQQQLQHNSRYRSYQAGQSINILCFGDSLTSGFFNHGRGKHPYSIRLSQLLNTKGSHRYRIETRGVIGEMVHGSMTKRLPKVLDEGTRFDWVLILGGTNDVAHVKNFGDDQDFTQQLIGVWSPKIVKDIEKLHEIAHSRGARTMLMTIPETAYEFWPEFRSIRNMRLSVNAALRKYATEVRDNTVLCDLAYKLPRSTLPKQMQKLYWNDHIHLNPVGYDKMAEVIQQCIQGYLQ